MEMVDIVRKDARDKLKKLRANPIRGIYKSLNIETV